MSSSALTQPQMIFIPKWLYQPPRPLHEEQEDFSSSVESAVTHLAGLHALTHILHFSEVFDQLAPSQNRLPSTVQHRLQRLIELGGPNIKPTPPNSPIPGVWLGIELAASLGLADAPQPQTLTPSRIQEHRLLSSTQSIRSPTVSAPLNKNHKKKW